jgi:HlyD family secretion protein
MKQRILDLLAKRRTVVVTVTLVAASAAVYGVAHFSTRPPTVPTFQVKRAEFLDVLEIRGQLMAMKSVTITAPANAGDLQIIKIATDGTQVKKGDVVVEFDPSKTQQDLAQDKSTLKSSQADIEQVRADGRHDRGDESQIRRRGGKTRFQQE